MTILRALQILRTVGCGSALVTRSDSEHTKLPLRNYDLPVSRRLIDAPPPEAGAVAPGATAIDARTTPSATVVSTWKPKVHGESTVQGWDVSTIGGESRVRLEPMATTFDVATFIVTASQGLTTPTRIIDIGTAIADLIMNETEITRPIPTVHWEDSASGWKDVTSTAHNERPAPGWTTVVSSELAHFESSADSWERTRPQDLPKPSKSRYIPVQVTDDPWTMNPRPPQLISAASPIDRQPQRATVSSRIITDYPAPAAVTYGEITVQPVAITRTLTVTAPDGTVTIADKIELGVDVGSSTLIVGEPVTLNNSIVVGLTTDAAGSTVLHVGDLTTILPEPTAGEVRTVAGVPPARLNIITSIIESTIRYIIAGKTLAPGQPVTIGDIPISIALDGESTVLYVGNKTTTLTAADTDLQTITDLASLSANPRETGLNNGISSAQTTSIRSESSDSTKVDMTLMYWVLGMAILVFTV